MKYYEVLRSQTCKAIGSKAKIGYDYDMWNKERKQFKTMAEVKKWLWDEYGKCKKVPMFRDLPNGSAEKCGNIYCYNTPKVDYNDCAKHNQDWVEVREIKATTLKF